MSFFRRLQQHRYFPDAVFITLLLGLSLYLMRPLFDWNTRVLASDLSGAWALFYWLKESLSTFHQVPTWSPLWMGGTPFFGMIPPASYFLILPVYLFTGDIPAAYNIATIFVFSLAGVSMYLYLRHVSRGRLLSFLGALIYIVLPVHTSSMMFWGLMDILLAYALAPLVLLFTDNLLDDKGQLNAAALGLLVALVLLLQLEYALIFLLFYGCYLIFALAIRGIGPRSMPALLRKNKVGIVLCLLVLLVPLSFYAVVLTQYGHFSGLTAHELERGLSYWTFDHFGDPFLERLTGGLEGYFDTPETDYYTGALSFVILLAAMASAITEKGSARARVLFFTLAGMVSLVLCMGLFGPLFPGLRRVVPFLSGMRAPVRFYYVFAICLPVLFVLSCVSLGRLLALAPRFTAPARRLLAIAIPVLVVAALILDFSPYLAIYHHRVLDKESYNRLCSFIQERAAEDRAGVPGAARILVFPALGAQPDRIARLEQEGNGQFTIETAESWVPWNQYEPAVEFNHAVYYDILGSRASLAFYAHLLSYDYIVLYRDKIPPQSLEEGYLDTMDQLEKTLNSLCADSFSALADRGSLETQYYSIRLYRINGESRDRTGFHALSDTLLLADDSPQASRRLFRLYKSMTMIAGPLTEVEFLDRVAAVYGEGGPLNDDSSILGPVPALFSCEGELLALQNDPSAVYLVEAEDCEARGWGRVDREGGWALANSGIHMAAGLADAAENSLRDSFTVASAGDWTLSVSYLGWFDTGLIDIYLDGELADTIDTYSQYMDMNTHTIRLSLQAGQHELNLLGRSAERSATGGSQGNWVEVDKIVLLNEAAVPRLVAQSTDLWARFAAAFLGSTVRTQVIEAEDCDAGGWVRVDREGCCGVPTSGFDMAVPDVSQAPDNYLRTSFLVGTEGDWTLDVSYLGHVDTGTMEVYVDDALVAGVDTFTSGLPRSTWSVNLHLGTGLHRLKIVGRPSSRNLTVGSMGDWVEVDCMTVRGGGPAVEARPAARAWISDLAVSPRGVSLDISAAEEGIVWIAYYANPWWRIYVDGEEAEILKINGVFPGCCVTEGEHHVEFIYNYPSPMNLFSLVPG